MIQILCLVLQILLERQLACAQLHYYYYYFNTNSFLSLILLLILFKNEREYTVAKSGLFLQSGYSILL